MKPVLVLTALRAMLYRHLRTLPQQRSFHPVPKHVEGIAGTLRKNRYHVRTLEEGELSLILQSQLKLCLSALAKFRAV